VETAKFGGFGAVILVAKHHDGFMLYPNSFTKHTVASSSWRGGQGDVVKEFAESCKAMKMNAAFYLSPWDRNYYNMTWNASYNGFYANTLQVLATAYGDWTEIWWDGANAQPHMTHYYDWKTWMAVVNKNQGDAVGGGCGGDNDVRDCGPDTVWIGNEEGIGKQASWSFSSASIEFPSSDPVWGGYFCDVSIRPGWFWHESENNKLKTLAELVEIYFASVGRNCMLQLNVPPNRDGLLESGDVALVKEFGNYVKQTFKHSFAFHGNATATSSRCGAPPSSAVDGSEDTFWMPGIGVANASLTVVLLSPAQANAVAIQEHISLGQVVTVWSVEIQSVDSAEWKVVARGATIGFKKLDRFPTVTAKAIRLNIIGTLQDESPAIELLGLYFAAPL